MLMLRDLMWRLPARTGSDADGITYVVLDPNGTRRQWGRVVATLAALAAFFAIASVVFDANYFVTTPMVTAYWVFIGVVLFGYRLLTPIGAVMGIRVTPHGVRLRSLLVRRMPRPDTGAAIRGCGPLPLGVGSPAPATFLPFSEMETVHRQDDTLFITMHDGATIQVPLQLVDFTDRTRITDELQDALQHAQDVGFTDRAEADAARAKLSGMLPRQRS